MLTHVRKPVRRNEHTNTHVFSGYEARELSRMAAGEEERQQEHLLFTSHLRSWGSERGCGTLQGSGGTSVCVVGRLFGPALTVEWDDLKEGVVGCEK